MNKMCLRLKVLLLDIKRKGLTPQVGIMGSLRSFMLSFLPKNILKYVINQICSSFKYCLIHDQHFLKCYVIRGFKAQEVQYFDHLYIKKEKYSEKHF